MKKLCFLALLLSVIVAAGRGKDDDYLGPNSNISDRFDPLFAQELEKRGYVDDAEHITLAEVKDITVLVVSFSERELTSLRGIEYFESLTELACIHNQLTTLDVSKNTALTSLNCWGNQLAALDVSKNTALTYLDCNDNQLTTLDVSKNTALTHLDCDDNQLTALDVSKNTALTKLFCEENQLISLNVSRNTVLTDLWCSDNQLTALDVSKNTALTYLRCGDNQLTALDVSKNTALIWLNCKWNPGDGSVFPVKAWFDNNSIPNSENFTSESWEYNGKTVRIDYRKSK